MGQLGIITIQRLETTCNCAQTFIVRCLQTRIITLTALRYKSVKVSPARTDRTKSNFRYKTHITSHNPPPPRKIQENSVSISKLQFSSHKSFVTADPIFQTQLSNPDQFSGLSRPRNVSSRSSTHISQLSRHVTIMPGVISG